MLVRRVLATLAAAVLLTGVVGSPASAVGPGSGTVHADAFHICDYIPFFPGCQN